MAPRKMDPWMFAQAREMLARAEQIRGQFFELRRGAEAPAWEPPADVFETPTELIVVVALPGVDIASAQTVIDGGELVVIGVRRLPAVLKGARIHRLELPHGRFERRVPLPAGRYDDVRREAADGCLIVRLHKYA
ncbi:MAG TPA: Hsp20/alpha crystallin family protein [Bauldia sp.]|nr:Hsp20/alpha crystallin family protein [Bauldia sp.]